MEIPKRIREAIDSDQLVIFAGSGISKKFELPDWETMTNEVIDIIEDESFSPLTSLMKSGIMTPLEALEKIKSHHNEISAYIKKHFRIPSDSNKLDVHKQLIELSGKIITTNYDNAFELASNDEILPAIYTSAFNISEIDKANEKYIFKLHGSFSEPDHCIVFPSQYADLYDEETAAKAKLKSIYQNKTILFIGFSFADPDINLIFNNLDKAFENNNKHFILTPDPSDFKGFDFLTPWAISGFEKIDLAVKTCLDYKKDRIVVRKKTDPPKRQKKDSLPKIAILFPNPLDIDFQDELEKVAECFSSLSAHLFLGTLNTRTLESLDDFDLAIIISKVFKTKIYIEDDNLKSNLLSPEEICMSIPNDEIPVLLIINTKIDSIEGLPLSVISTFKSAIIKRFMHKTLQKQQTEYTDDDISCGWGENNLLPIQRGKATISNIYNNNRDLDIGKKCLTNVIGRVEEQSNIASRIISTIRTNKLFNLKASGGIGKTTLIKKIGYELYLRGYFKNGVIFKSCENIKSLNDFKAILVKAFNLSNILDFKEYLISNYSNKKLDLLIILDNFETIANALNEEDLRIAIDILRFATDYASIAITSREKVISSTDFEDVYSLTPLITDDAVVLFQEEYGIINNEHEERILRHEILEDILNNNPLAIKLVTKSRTKLSHIAELRDQLKEHFFESTTENYSAVFDNDADLNIERTKSIFQSINYSYATLTEKEKTAFELLSLFPDGISLSNFKRCFSKNKSQNQISDSELRMLRNKSLIEDYNGTLQLQPIIRRFSDFQFNDRPYKTKTKYCTDAYSFNSFILGIIGSVEENESLSEALRLFDNYKNNFLKVLSYIPNIEISERTGIPSKKYLLNYIFDSHTYFLENKQIREFKSTVLELKSFFSDVFYGEKLLDSISLKMTYFHEEFDNSYLELSKLFPPEEIELRVFQDEDHIESRFKDIIADAHGYEGYNIQIIKSYVRNNSTRIILNSSLFHLGIPNIIYSEGSGFFNFEQDTISNNIDLMALEKYIKSLHPEEHLKLTQSTYTLSKIKRIEKSTIDRLVVTNPYTKGLKELMFAFISEDRDQKRNHFENAIHNLFHIKYYYLEALYHYSLFLKEFDKVDFSIKVEEGLSLSSKFYYQYLSFLFKNLKEQSDEKYMFSYSFYPIEGLEDYIKFYNHEWEEEMRKKKS